ncbi:hypothetical protein VKT23_004613 [Stygiomarasmius scandens]|uniref:Uncharacterized protein n=1 Tax=Marasmiellus scandens TaxID=2682957 RepID=A0ABR1JV66_9AGAR
MSSPNSEPSSVRNRRSRSPPDDSPSIETDSRKGKDKVRAVSGPDREEYDKVLQQNRHMEQTIKALQDHLQNSRNRIERLENLNSDLTVENESHKNSINHLAIERQHVFEEAISLRNSNQQGNAVLAEHMKTIEERENAIAQRDDEILNLRAMQAEAQRIETEQEIEIANLRKRTEDLRNIPLQWLNTRRPSSRRKKAERPQPAINHGLRFPHSTSGVDDDVNMDAQRDGEDRLTEETIRTLILDVLQKMGIGSYKKRRPSKPKKTEGLTDEEWNLWRAVVREVFKEIMQVPGVNDFRMYWPATEEEVGQYEKDLGDGPGTGYRLYFGETHRWRQCAWNKKVIENVVSVVVRVHQPMETGLPALSEDTIGDMVMGLVVQAQQSWKSLVPRFSPSLGRVENGSEATERAAEQEKKRANATRKRSRKQQKHDDRFEATEQMLAEYEGNHQQTNKWKKLQDLVLQLGIDGQSSDEEVMTHGSGTYISALKSSLPGWRRRKIRCLLTEIDEAGDLLRMAKPHKARKARIRGDLVNRESKVKKGLPLNFYHRGWLGNTSERKKQGLGISQKEFPLLNSDTEEDL